nr:MAG TPA: stabilization protein [Crassvirales sp.]
MALKKEQHFFKGMQRDLSVSKFNPEYAFDAQNIRITARDNNTLLTVTNERGNKAIPLKSPSGATVAIDGVLLGNNVLNNYITLFTKGTKDNIYRLENKGTYFETITLFSGNLNFSTDHPIENIGVYENNNIQKVYWIDGLNQSRVINIVATDAVRAKWDNDSFNFVQDLNLNETVTITRNDLASGSFSSGVIQYAFTYYNKYGQESNVFYTSPLEYISFASRGASPEEKVSNSFTITIENADTRFDYVRVYSIHRASIDATPNVLNVVDIPINPSNTQENLTLTYVDNGTTGTSVDPTELLYVGGEDIVFGTMTQKDNTLFLGNANIQRKLVGTEIIDAVKGGNVSFGSKYVGNYVQTSGFYPYKNSLYLGSKVKSFKYLEWYRFGIQFQHKSGKWSEPVWVNDSYNSQQHPNLSGSLSLVQATYALPANVIQMALDQGFIRVRGVVVYPSLTDREVIAQGILCPTVYNVGDRFSNSPFAQASWFSRPNLAFDITKNQSNWTGLSGSWTDYANSKAAVIKNTNVNLTVDGGATYLIDIVNKGAWAEFRHNKPIPNNWERGAEIQCLANVPDSPYVLETGSNLNSWAANHAEYFFIDQSILTLHSPDIEFDDSVQNLDASGLKMRIVGVVPMTGNASDIDIQTSTPANDVDKMGFYKEFVGVENNSYHGLKSLVSGAYWFDKMTNMEKVDDDHGYTEAFMVYAWHRNGSLNNQGATTINPDTGVAPSRTAMLDKKKISNMKFSSFSYFLDTPWLAYRDNDNNHTGITGVNIFNSNEQSLVRIPAPANSGLGDLNYYGNIDKVLAATRVDDSYTVTMNFSDGEKTETLNRKDGYPIAVTGVNNAATYAHQLFVGGSFPIQFVKRSDGKQLTSVPNGTDAVRIKYKSTPHAVFALNWTKDGKQVVLPTNMETDYTDTWAVNEVKPNVISNKHFFWNPSAKRISENVDIGDNIYQDTISGYTSSFYDNNYSYLFLAELYNDNVQNRFGGQTEEAFENNHWLPAGEPYSLTNAEGSPLPYLIVYYTEGDTFFQRNDCMKVYPYTLEDQNSVTDIVSFMCETRVNIEGRYDRNRGQISNLTMTPTNFNLMNPVYNQANNFFNYRAINHDKFNLNYFPNIITWTKEKQLGSIIDTWTNITMASTLDLDGDKGEVVSLNTFKNEIFAFQKMGLSNILFNSRVQIPTSDGLPIEITNGLKVSGKRYISNTIGCANKWSIVESPSGLYFVDNETNSLYIFNGEIMSLSDKLGFRQWISAHNVHTNWDPVNYNNYRSFYDKNNNDVYFTYKDHCLCYSELINQFTSFMSYEKVPAMFNVSSDFYAFKDGQMWEMFTGDYNMFFGEYKPFSITFVANAEEPSDKIFNTVEFRADSWEGDTLINNKTFDTLDVWNEYQHGTTQLTNLLGRPSPLKKKFRIWRANIPRDTMNNRDRIRNTWAYIKLGMNTPNTNRTEFHDAIIHYFA